MEDGSGHRANHLPAVIAGIRWTASDTMMFAILLAFITRAVRDAIRKTLLFQVLNASIIVGKLAIEVLKGKAQFLGNGLFNFVRDFHDAFRLPEYLLDVKG